MSRKEPTNAEIMAELKRQGAKTDRINAILEGLVSQSGRPETPPDLFGNIKGLGDDGPVMPVK